MDLGDIVVCKTIVKENDKDNLDYEWHYYGPESAGNKHYPPPWAEDELLKENAQDPTTWVSIEGWSGSTEDRQELHDRFAERSYNREWCEWKENCHEVDEDHHKWEDNLMSSQYQPWWYGCLVGTPHPDNRDPDTVQYSDDESVAIKQREDIIASHRFWCGAPKTTGYPDGYKDDENNYPFKQLDEGKFLQGFRERSFFNDMYGMEPEIYLKLVYKGFEPVRPEWVDYVDPADANVPAE